MFKMLKKIFSFKVESLPFLKIFGVSKPRLFHPYRSINFEQPSPMRLEYKEAMEMWENHQFGIVEHPGVIVVKGDGPIKLSCIGEQ